METPNKRRNFYDSASQAGSSSSRKPREEKMREDAYALQAPEYTGDYVYPYLIINWIPIIPIEQKFWNLEGNEVAKIYCKDHANPFHSPKDFQYYQEILIETGSASIYPVDRAYGIAFSKFVIRKILTPENWTGDLNQPKELRVKYGPKLFTYFDYIAAWEGALLYENPTGKFSWWFQLKLEDEEQEIPIWFFDWFSKWGFYQIILPKSVHQIFDDFVAANPKRKYHRFLFAMLYQVPWIIKWDYQVKAYQTDKHGDLPWYIPHLGRRINIKWWGKFDFFGRSVYTEHGLIRLDPPEVPKIEEQVPSAKDIFKDLLKTIPKEELKRQLFSAINEDFSESHSPPNPLAGESQDPYDLGID